MDNRLIEICKKMVKEDYRELIALILDRCLVNDLKKMGQFWSEMGDLMDK